MSNKIKPFGAGWGGDGGCGGGAVGGHAPPPRSRTLAGVGSSPAIARATSVLLASVWTFLVLLLVRMLRLLLVVLLLVWVLVLLVVVPLLILLPRLMRVLLGHPVLLVRLLVVIHGVLLLLLLRWHSMRRRQRWSRLRLRWRWASGGHHEAGHEVCRARVEVEARRLGFSRGLRGRSTALVLRHGVVQEERKFVDGTRKRKEKKSRLKNVER